MQENFHTKEVLFKTKPTHMQGAPKPIMEEILNRCDAGDHRLGAEGRARRGVSTTPSNCRRKESQL